jgi:uncharacterized surface protein with fasciclin (FAS1) repeats
MSNITQVVNVDKNMKTLKKAIHFSDLDQLLSSTDPFTFFAPTDLAFEKQGANYIEDMLNPITRDTLAQLMNNHIVAGKVAFSDLKDGDRLETVNGKQLLVEVKNGVVHIGEATIVAREQKVSNGVIHLSDGVLGK